MRGKHAAAAAGRRATEAEELAQAERQRRRDVEVAHRAELEALRVELDRTRATMRGTAEVLARDAVVAAQTRAVEAEHALDLMGQDGRRSLAKDFATYLGQHPGTFSAIETTEVGRALEYLFGVQLGALIADVYAGDDGTRAFVRGADEEVATAPRRVRRGGAKYMRGNVDIERQFKNPGATVSVAHGADK